MSVGDRELAEIRGKWESESRLWQSDIAQHRTKNSRSIHLCVKHKMHEPSSHEPYILVD